MPKGESLYHKVPGYRVELEPIALPVRVRFAGEVLAESRRALLVRETRHDPVLYFPREDVRLERLARTDHRTTCPFKGEASYWTIQSAERAAENAVWTYEDPFPEVAGLKDFVAFYADRVDWEFPEGSPL